MMRLHWIILGAASLSLGHTQAQSNPPQPVEQISTVQRYDAQTHQPLYRRTYSLSTPTTKYRGFYYNPEYIDRVSWGLWYSNESLTDPQPLAQNPAYFQSRGGMGTEILSGNLLPKLSPSFKHQAPENWQSKGYSTSDVKHYLEKSQTARGALYAGFGFGFGFLGRGERSNVTLNTNREDSGYTYLKNQVVSMWGKVQYEKRTDLGAITLYPFVSVAAGPRIFTTQQDVYTYLTLTDYESPTANVAYDRAVFATEFTLGTKVRLGSAVSLFVSQSFWRSTDIDFVDLQASKFNGLAYDLVKSKLSSNTMQWKVGLVFDLSEARYYSYQVDQTVMDTLWYYQAIAPTPVDSMVYDSASQSWVKVRYYTCPCCLNPPQSNTVTLPQTATGEALLETIKPAGTSNPIQQSQTVNPSNSANPSGRNRNNEPPRYYYEEPTYRYSNPSDTPPNRSSGTNRNTEISPGGKRPAPTISAPKIKN
jgi:hypothetical protein